jgi:putative transcriptional regulator
MVLRNRVRESRLKNQFTQETLADMVSVTRQTIIALEKGGYTPSVELALKLAHALQVPVQKLFWLDEGPKGEGS